MVSIEEVVAAYLSAWNEGDEAARRALVERCWAADGSYTDPTAHVEGRGSLLAHIAGFHQQMPGARLERTSGIDEHHRRIRFTWTLRGADGQPAMEGIDVCELDADGRLKQITGFFGPPPPLHG